MYGVAGETGYAAFPLVDPRLISDINGDGFIDLNDFKVVTKAVVAGGDPLLPDLPVPDNSRAIADLGSGSASIGQIAVVPLTIRQLSASADSVHASFGFDPTKLDLVRIRSGTLTLGLASVDQQREGDNLTVVNLETVLKAQHRGDGTLVEIEFRVRNGVSGSQAVDLRSVMVLRGDTPTPLEQTPVVGGTEAADGSVEVISPGAGLVARAAGFSALARFAAEATSPPVPTSSALAVPGTPGTGQANGGVIDWAGRLDTGLINAGMLSRQPAEAKDNTAWRRSGWARDLAHRLVSLEAKGRTGAPRST